MNEEEDLHTKDEFIAKALRTLKLQNDEMTKINLAMVMRIKALEEANLWNIMQGNIEQVPVEPSPFVNRTAGGKVAFKQREENEETSD